MNEGMSPPNEDVLTRHIAERDCEKLVTSFAAHCDRREYAELVDLFAKDGTFQRPRTPDVTIKGRQAILASFETRPRDEITRHVVTNVRIALTSDRLAKGRFYLTLFAGHDDGAADHFGARSDGRVLVADIEDEYVKTTEGWKILSRRGRIVLNVGN